MDEPQNICPKCLSARTELKGGLVYCPSCGFEGEVQKPDPSKRTGLFWVSLITPAAFALLSFVVGQSSKNLREAGAAIGAVDLLIGLVASIYCGAWLAKRTFASDGLRLLFGFIFAVGIGVVNFFIICVGCGPNL